MSSNLQRTSTMTTYCGRPAHAVLRKLLREMVKRLPTEEIKQHGEMCPGGDLRVRRNRWLYEAVECAKKGRVLRESKVQLIVGYLSFKHQLGRLLRTAAHQQYMFNSGLLRDLQKLPSGPSHDKLEGWIKAEAPLSATSFWSMAVSMVTRTLPIDRSCKVPRHFLQSQPSH